MGERPESVRIRRLALAAMVTHARDELPNECCGLLVGSTDTVDRVVPARNLRASPTRFEVDPADHFRAIRSARADGLAVVGAYHSHPRTAPDPSPTDRAEATDPGALALIVTPGRETAATDRVRGFRQAHPDWIPVTLIEID